MKVPENVSFFLFGPRGTGKSTWLDQKFPGALKFDLLDAETFRLLQAKPERLGAFIPDAHKGVVIVDEIQKVPELLDEVHRLISKRKIKFALTGSSARKLKKSGANLLAGRAHTYRFSPLTATELGDRFDLKNSLLLGHLPQVYSEPNPQKYLSSYVGTYLKEEVQQEALVRDLGAFSRFLESASFSQASIVVVKTVAQDCGVERRVAEGFFTLCEDLLIAHRIPVFQKRAKRKMSAHPKFYFFDVGVFRSLRPQGPLDPAAEIEGAAIETLLFQELFAANNNHDLEYQIFHWRTHSKVEVDFVLYGPKGFFAIEVKRSSRFREDDLKGLKLFNEDYPKAKRYLAYLGDKEFHFDGIDVVPLGTLLKRLPTLLG